MIIKSVMCDEELEMNVYKAVFSVIDTILVVLLSHGREKKRPAYTCW